MYETLCGEPRSASSWQADEQLHVLGPGNIDAELSPGLYSFLGGDEVNESLQSVRRGDALFAVKKGEAFVHCGYILFQTRSAKIAGEVEPVPVIGNCKTAIGAQGRGLYRKALNEEIRYLNERGYSRVIIITSPDNVPSQKGIEAAGFHLIRRVTAIIILNVLVISRVREKDRSRLSAIVLRPEKPSSHYGTPLHRYES